MRQVRENNPLVFQHKFIDKNFDCAMISVTNALLSKAELFLIGSDDDDDFKNKDVIAFYCTTDNIMEDRNVPRDAVNRAIKKLQDLGFLRITDRAGAFKVNKRHIKQCGFNSKDTTKYLIFDYHKMTLDENLCILFPAHDYDEELKKAKAKKKKGAEDADEFRERIRDKVNKYNEKCREHRAKFKRYAEYMEAAQDEVINKNDCREAIRVFTTWHPSIKAPLKDRDKYFRETAVKIAESKGYDKETCDAFCDYWTEYDDNGVMRFEDKPTFDIAVRFRRFVENQN